MPRMRPGDRFTCFLLYGVVLTRALLLIPVPKSPGKAPGHACAFPWNAHLLLTSSSSRHSSLIQSCSALPTTRTHQSPASKAGLGHEQGGPAAGTGLTPSLAHLCRFSPYACSVGAAPHLTFEHLLPLSRRDSGLTFQAVCSGRLHRLLAHVLIPNPSIP